MKIARRTGPGIAVGLKAVAGIRTGVDMPFRRWLALVLSVAVLAWALPRPATAGLSTNSEVQMGKTNR